MVILLVLTSCARTDRAAEQQSSARFERLVAQEWFSTTPSPGSCGAIAPGYGGALLITYIAQQRAIVLGLADADFPTSRFPRIYVRAGGYQFPARLDDPILISGSVSSRIDMSPELFSNLLDILSVTDTPVTIQDERARFIYATRGNGSARTVSRIISCVINT